MTMDDVVITFTSAPVADAGPDAAACASAVGHQVSGASHAGGIVTWSTSGNGTFDDTTIDNPLYTFGTADYTAGLVTLTMEVAGGGSCGTVSSSMVITINPLPVPEVTSQKNISCTGLTDGEIHLSASSGLPPYSYSIDGAPYQPSGDFTGLSAASYFFEVMDANGCTSGITSEITEPLPFTATLDSAHHVTCNGATDGAVFTTVAGGTEPYSINWTGPSGFTASTPDITGLAAGTYTVTATDMNSCATYSFIEVITQPDAIVLTGSVLSDYGGFGVQCPESADGSITVSATGGIPPLSFMWTGPGGFTSTESSISSLMAGTYSLVITDTRGCILTEDFILTAPEAMMLSAVTVNATCPDTPDGSIDLTVAGGAGTLDYRWDDEVTTADRTALLPGDHTVTVTDANGCVQLLTVTLGVVGIDCLRVYEIITPNGDGRNDTWILRNAVLYPDAEVFVYSRWGKLVYHSRNAGEEWDGTYNGKLLPNDSYHYVIHLNDGSEPRTGIISIISK